MSGDRPTLGSTPWSIAVGCWTWLAACVLVPLLAIYPQLQDGQRTLFFLQFGIVIYAGTRLAVLVARSQVRLMAGALWMFCYVALGLAPLAQVTTGIRSVVIKDPGTLLPATVMVAIAIVLGDIGYVLHGRVRPARSETRTPPTSPRLNVGRPKGFTLGSLAGSAIYIAAVGAIVFFRSREAIGSSLAARGFGATATASDHAGAGVLLGVGTAPILIALLCWTVLLCRPARYPRDSAIRWWLVAAGANVVVNNPIANPCS